MVQEPSVEQTNRRNCGSHSKECLSQITRWPLVNVGTTALVDGEDQRLQLLVLAAHEEVPAYNQDTPDVLLGRQLTGIRLQAIVKVLVDFIKKLRVMVSRKVVCEDNLVEHCFQNNEIVLVCFQNRED